MAGACEAIGFLRRPEPGLERGVHSQGSLPSGDKQPDFSSATSLAAMVIRFSRPSRLNVSFLHGSLQWTARFTDGLCNSPVASSGRPSSTSAGSPIGLRDLFSTRRNCQRWRGTGQCEFGRPKNTSTYRRISLSKHWHGWSAAAWCGSSKKLTSISDSRGSTEALRKVCHILGTLLA